MYWCDSMFILFQLFVGVGVCVYVYSEKYKKNIAGRNERETDMIREGNKCAGTNMLFRSHEIRQRDWVSTLYIV